MDCKISKKFANTQEKREKMHFFALFLRKYLVNSKKSSTFAAGFEKTTQKAEVLSKLNESSLSQFDDAKTLAKNPHRGNFLRK